MAKINWSQFDSRVAKREGKKVQTPVGQVREIRKLVIEELRRIWLAGDGLDMLAEIFTVCGKKKRSKKCRSRSQA